jgi:RNA 3'-terminal phosphate cyclase (ATP)
VGPGNCVSVQLAFEHVTEVATGFGERGVSAEAVAERVARDARRYLAADAPVGEHLADQLMIPLALLAGGRYRTLAPSRHARTNADVVNLFLPGAVRFEERGPDDWIVTVAGRESRPQ